MKRALDILVALVGSSLLLPLFCYVALRVRAQLGSPVLFSQVRPGMHGKPFRMWKFRSMTDERGSDGQLLADSDRLPRFGQVLRSTSLDELPELWNVLVGDMSIVGPRPLLMQYLPLYSPQQARRHEVRPGITGWAQINGRNAISWEERFELDVWYVDHRDLWLDVKIFFLTFSRVFQRRGVSAQGEATMHPFTGTPTPQSGRKL